MNEPPSRNPSHWKAYSEDASRFFQEHALAHFVVIFCVVFTSWSFASLFNWSERVALAASQVRHAGIVAFLTAIILAFLRWQQRRGSPQAAMWTKRVLWVVAALFLLFALVLQFI